MYPSIIVNYFPNLFEILIPNLGNYDIDVVKQILSSFLLLLNIHSNPQVYSQQISEIIISLSQLLLSHNLEEFQKFLYSIINNYNQTEVN
jgi:hypothetical protein